MFKNDMTGTNLESASRDDAVNLLNSLIGFAPVDVVEESDFQMQDEIKKDLQISAERRQEVMAKAADQTLDDDFKDAKKNLRGLAERQLDILDDLIAIAKASDSPRAYEVVATMLKTFADLEGSILDLHSKKADIEKKTGTGKQEADTITNTQNNFFVGSPRELIEMRKNQ
jgi:valyl-tRNA synthetase